MPRKGQTLSAESIKKKIESDRKRLLSKYDWSLAEDFLDVKMNMSSRGRKKSFITLRQFRDMLLDGIQIRQFRKYTSGSLASFFSAFCQGKIKLSKDIFITEYKSGKSMKQIAKDYNISVDYIGLLRQLYGIKVRGATYIRRKQTEVPLTQRQKKIIYGSLMGDAKKCSPSSIGFNHGEKQEAYLMWKYNEIKSIMSPKSLKKYVDISHRSGNTNEGIRCYTYANSDVEEIVAEFYKNGKREVTQKILNEITPLSMAVWFMDDGKTDWHYRVLIKHPTWDIKPSCYLCTDSFSKKSCDLIVEWFKEKWLISTHLHSRSRGKNGEKQYRIIIDSVSSYDFINLICPYILPLFYYKIDYEAYKKWREQKSVRYI